MDYYRQLLDGSRAAQAEAANQIELVRGVLFASNMTAPTCLLVGEGIPIPLSVQHV